MHSLCLCENWGISSEPHQGCVSKWHANGHSFKQLTREPKSYMDSGNPVPSLIEGVETIFLPGEYISY